MPTPADSTPHARTPMGEQALRRALALRDLTDPAAGTHAMQHIIDRVEDVLARGWRVPVRRHRGPRVVAVADNYDRLRYPPAAMTRAARYTRYVDRGRMLRSHTTAAIPGLLHRYAHEPGPADAVLSVPGICYRRDVIDRTHVGEPHQLDLWRIRRDGPRLGDADLLDMIARVVTAVLPGAAWRCAPRPHPYTVDGREILVRVRGAEVEVGECGLAHPGIVAAAGLGPSSSGLAMGLGLDRLTMLAKGIDDIRLLRGTDPLVAGQMADLAAYRPVSTMPAARRDLSLIVAADLDAELLGDRVRTVLGHDADVVEEIVVLAETHHADMPGPARSRTGIRLGQKNVLLRLVLRDLRYTLTAVEANLLRDRVYAGMHEGTRHEWASAGRRRDGPPTT